MKRLYILLMVACALWACNDVTVDYSYSPTTPRAGQAISFTNLSTEGEEWLWSFGDGTSSTLKNPTHTYKQKGTYMVSLQVDNRSSYTRILEIEVLDTVPDFTCDSTDGMGIFADLTFQAQVYNPYNYVVSYLWSVLGETAYQPISTSNQQSSFSIYFQQVAPEVTVQLRLVMNSDTTYVRHTYAVGDMAAPSVLLRTATKDYQQRIYGTRFETPKTLAYSEGTLLLEQDQDTLQVYNDSTFCLSKLRKTFSLIQGFRIASRKIYYITPSGLYVANVDGTNSVQIDSQSISALAIDTQTQRLYWATNKGVFYMPFIGSSNNHFTKTPTQLNTLEGVTKIAIDNTLR